MEAVKEEVALAKRLRDEVGIADGYSYDLAYGKRQPSDGLAINIWRKIGVKLGPISDASDAEIEVLARIRGAA